MKLNLKIIIDSTFGEAYNLSSTKEITGIEIDSRKVNENLCFFPILGESFDGHQFLEKAFENGCKVSVCERAYFYTHYDALKNYSLVLVDNSTKALQRIAKYILIHYKPRVVGITGSVGKTSTKEFVYHILKQKYSVHKNKGNLNNHIGLPLTVLDLEESHDVVILEMGMNHMKEIETLSEIGRPEIAIITNIGTSHIGILGSQENIFQAKLEISSYLNESDTLILNGKDSFLSRVDSSAFEVCKVGTDVLVPYDIRIENNGCYSFYLDYEKQNYQIKLNVLGKHNIQNSLLAIMVGLKFKVPMADIVSGISDLSENKGRLDIIKLNHEIEIISDCYNASEDSTKSAVEVLMNRNTEHKIAILGDILELGSFSELTHRRIGEYIQDKTLCLVSFGPESKYTFEEAYKTGVEKELGKHFIDQEALIKYVKSIIKPNTSVLVKGSFGMNMIKIVEELIKE